jgi:dihydropteroate synthase
MEIGSKHIEKRMTLNCGGTLLSLEKPLVMSILNITDDSFYSGSRFSEKEKALETAGKMLEDGASILDIGGYSSRPGAKDISVQEEMDRVIPVVELIHHQFPEAIISVDTFRASVAKSAAKAGATMINDISAGDDDNEMIETIAGLGLPYVAMHKKGSPQTMQRNPQYENVVSEVLDYLIFKGHALRHAGINDVIWDPGFGFGKTVQHNYQLLANLESFTPFGYPLLVGISRKSMIYKPLNIDAENALNGTTALHMFALMNGADILRVHDVKDAVQCVALFERLRGGRVDGLKGWGD